MNATPPTEIKIDRSAQDWPLEGFNFFAGIESQAVAAFSRAARWCQYRAGAMIFDQETDGLEVHFVVEGKIRLLANVDGGDPITLGEVMTGQIFGELAAIDQLPRSARAVAACDCVLGSIEGPTFVKLLGEHPQVALRVLSRMASIIRSMDVRLANTVALSSEQRVIAELMRRAEPDLRVPGTWIIPFAPSHAEVASWTGLSRADVAQALGSLAREAMVRRRGGSLILMDWAALRERVKPGSSTSS